MMNNPTIDKLQGLKLYGMAAEFERHWPTHRLMIFRSSIAFAAWLITRQRCAITSAWNIF
jgi:hypothetical protein